MFGKNGLREFAISLPKQQKCKSEQMSLSLLKTWIAAIMIVSSFSVYCRCFNSFRDHVACHFNPLEGLQYVHVSQLPHCDVFSTFVLTVYLIFKSRLSLIVRVNVALNRTVVVDSLRHNLPCSHDIYPNVFS